MNPYPFALLNHFTVPFRRSTCAPLISREPWKRWKFPGTAKYAGIVGLPRGTVKDAPNKNTHFSQDLWPIRTLKADFQRLFRLCWASQRTEASVLASRISPL